MQNAQFLSVYLLCFRYEYKFNIFTYYVLFVFYSTTAHKIVYISLSASPNNSLNDSLFKLPLNN